MFSADSVDPSRNWSNEFKSRNRSGPTLKIILAFVFARLIYQHHSNETLSLILKMLLSTLSIEKNASIGGFGKKLNQWFELKTTLK